MDRQEILLELNKTARKEFAFATTKACDEREVEKHTYCGRVIMRLLDGMLAGKLELTKTKK